jgi:hypothetical protein
MRVLFLTCHLPYPPFSGGRLREFQLLKRLADTVDLHVVTVSRTPAEDRANASSLARMCSDVRVFEAANGAGRKPGPRQVQVHRCGEVVEYIQEVIGNDEVDLVHVEGFYLMQHVPDPCACPILLVEQNVEYQLWLQRVAVEPDAARRDAYLAQLRSTWTEEIAAWQRSDLVAVLTEEDRAVLAAHPGLDVRIVPDGADHVRPARFDRARSVAGEPLVVFVANFGYEPNQDAARVPVRGDRSARGRRGPRGAVPARRHVTARRSA